MKNSEHLLHLLRTFGVATSGNLQERLGIGRATFLRAANELGDEVVSRGNARRTAYGARRSVRGSSAPIALYRIDEAGKPHDAAAIYPLHTSGVAVEFLEPPPWPLDDGMRDGWFEGIPYFLDDMRPQGFLGRQFAAAHADLLQINPNPQRWSEDDALYALSLIGTDLPGNYVLGEVALRAVLNRQAQEPIAANSIAKQYLELAKTAMAGGNAGSSAAGEFPKFTAYRVLDGEPAHVLVKFSGLDDSPGTKRWSDLLVCEHLALKSIASHLGVRVSLSNIYQAGGRTFLEVKRFDRVSRSGRSPVCSWACINAALVGRDTWSGGSQELAKRGLISEQSAFQVECLTLFGKLIANTDMHDGNLSFVPVEGGLELAPAYDMLPMAYAPARGVELYDVDYKTVRPLPSEREAWDMAARAALFFWQSASVDIRVSNEFRATCAHNARALENVLEGETGL